MRFVDLFAGLGGFHVALERLGGTCVFASEIDPDLQALYEQNFNLRPKGDIREVNSAEIPDHDVLCAGFPCQPFSKAGAQLGFDDPKSGDLWSEVVRILDRKRPTFVILENVANLERHNEGKTLTQILDALSDLGYDHSFKRLNAFDFGVPQTRERLYIVAAPKNGLDGFYWPEGSGESPDIRTALDQLPPDATYLTEDKSAVLDVWQEFLDRIPSEDDLPWFPIWAMEFGADYPFENTTPYATGNGLLRNYRGAFGTSLRSVDPIQRLDFIPKYSRGPVKTFPGWKQTFIRLNREFFVRHSSVLKDWIPKVREFPDSFQKFEWNCKGEAREINRHVVQFRASGVRVKRSTSAPALVSLTASQVPVIPWEKRYMTVREAARLQALHSLKMPKRKNAAFRALGNAVNADVAFEIGKALLSNYSGGALDGQMPENWNRAVPTGVE